MDFMNRRRTWLLFFLGLSFAAIFVLVSSLPGLQFRPGKSLNLLEWIFAELASKYPQDVLEFGDMYTRSNFLPEIGDVLLNSLIATFWLLAILSIVIFFVSPKFRRELVRLVAIFIPMVILLPQIAANMTPQPMMGEEEGAGEYLLGDTTFPQPPPFIQDPPEWVFLTVNVILLSLILGGIFLLWRRYRPKPDAQAVIVKEVRRALLNLESGAEFKDAVIACYAQMCVELKESQQVIRHRAMTPREFENHLSAAGIASTHIKQLTLLFEGVRYGAKSSSEATVNEAKRCLRSILEVYGE